MNVTLSLNPEMEKGLLARANARGVSLDDYLQELVAREAGLPTAAELHPIHQRFENLSDLLVNSPFSGADLDLERAAIYQQDRPGIRSVHVDCHLDELIEAVYVGP